MHFVPREMVLFSFVYSYRGLYLFLLSHAEGGFDTACFKGLNMIHRSFGNCLFHPFSLKIYFLLGFLRFFPLHIYFDDSCHFLAPYISFIYLGLD